MKPSIYRRIRRRTASHEAVNSKKENKQESSFFGDAATEHFFQPAPVITQPSAINRKCEECEQEDKKVQRAADKKEEDKTLQRMTDKKEEDKLQRQPEKKEEEKLMKKGEEKEEDKIQKKEAGNHTSTPVTSSYISSLNSKGTPLPKQSQQFFGSRMGYDFSNVKVHTDQEAARSAKEVNAKAYTAGEHIVFNEGQYDTNSAEGKKLMAHELAHVAQNNNSYRLQRQPISSNPPWLSKNYKGELPGEKLSMVGPYTENDRVVMKGLLTRRIKENRNNITKYISGLVNGTIRILGEFMLVEMNKAAQDGMSGFGKNIKFIISETAQFIAAGGVGYIAKNALRPAVAKGLKFVADKTTGRLADLVGDSLDENIRNEKLDEKKKFLSEILTTVADKTSEIIEEILPQMGQNEGDYREWLATASLEELYRFAIPEVFPVIDVTKLNAIIAGQIAKTASRHTYSYGILGEAAHHMGPNEYNLPDAAHYMDDNIVIAHATPYMVKDIQFHSSSKVLTDNIVGKISVGALPNIPLIIHLISDRKNVNDMAGRFLTALWGYKPSINEIEIFHNSFISSDTPIIIRRNKSGHIVVSEGGSVADALWLYAMATSDYSFQSLVEEIQLWQEGEDNMYQEQVSSSFVNVTDAAKKLSSYIPMFYKSGAKVIIETMLNDKVPQMPENRFSESYWKKDNRGFFKGRRSMTYNLY